MILKILGIDPGTATTGYGLIEHSGKAQKMLCFGCVKTLPSQLDHERLLEIHEDVLSLIEKHKPDAVVIEKLYFATNAKTAIAVGQARGVLMLAVAKKSIPLIELTPLQAKQGLTGYGKADKKQMQEMVRLTLGLKEVPKPDDAADALALAIVGASRVGKVD